MPRLRNSSMVSVHRMMSPAISAMYQATTKPTKPRFMAQAMPAPTARSSGVAICCLASRSKRSSRRSTPVGVAADIVGTSVQ